jgi:hypothetical protein
MLKQTMQADSIISRTHAVVQEWIEVRGNLLEASAPIGLVAFDLLRAIGLPSNGIEMALGSDLCVKVDPETFYTPYLANQLKCALCEEEASQVVNTKGGNNLLVCNEHKTALVELGAKVVSA